MFVGHFGLGLAGKRIAPRASLGTWFLAVQLLDLLWPFFLLLGWEHVRITPGYTRMNPLDFYDYPLTHSLLGACVWAALLGGLYLLATRGRGPGRRRVALLLAAGVVSHWFLDVLVHRADLPVLPVMGPYLGLGLWNQPAVTIVLELLIFGAGIALYLRATRARDAAGRWGFAALIGFLLLTWLGAAFGPPPDEGIIAWSALLLWLLVPWGCLGGPPPRAGGPLSRSHEPAMQTSDERDPQPLTWYEAFLAESTRLNPSFAVPDDTGDIGDIRDGGDPSTRLSRLNRAAFDAGRTALCLSGGGIRSASFAVGVLQALAQRGLIRGFDYLSTVSGGGFAGAWLSTWLHRAGTGHAGTPPDSTKDDDDRSEQSERDDPDQAHAALRLFEGAPGSAAAAVEPWPVTRLRSSTRYLSPATGFFSADSWGLVATLLRNTLLNWAVLLPLLAAAMLVPRFQFALLHLLEQEPNSARSLWSAFDFQALVVATIAFTVAIVHIIANLPSFGNRGQSERQFLAWGLLPLSVGTLALTFYWATWAALDIDLAQFTAGGALVSLVVCAGTGLIAGSRPFRPRTWLAAAVSGAVGALVYWQLLETLFNYDDLSREYVTFAFPLIMVTLLLQAVVFVGLAGREMVAADLEWWSRAAAWILIVGAGWLIVCGVAFGVPLLFGRLLGWLPHAIQAVGGAAAVAGGLMSWLLRPSAEGAGPSWQRRVMLALAAPVSVVLIVGGVAALDDRMVRALTTVGDDRTFMAPFQRWPICQPAQEAEYSRYHCHPADGGFGETVVLFVALLVIGYLTSRLVPANKFSLHDMYHHRLTRAYLGASRYERKPNAFTGFDPEDDVELAALADQRPFHVVNTTLNTRLDPRLGQRVTQAFSFTLSPLHAGSNVLGAYRPSADYAFDPLRRHGITLGTAVTVSGAAASPQMGEYTSPALAFLLTIFNARLGIWLGNPGPAGRSTWRRRDPKAAFGPLLREMLGWTTEANPYVFLSDGGHFDNLGLWEMVLRRVRHIVIVDSGCDPEYRFEDLATAVRRARVDHGAEIVFDAETMNALRDEPLKPHVVTGTIRYVESPGEAGTVFYIKPGLSNDEPVDVVTYRKAHPTFPHESTANQWFTEAQFESYRALGFHSVQAALADTSEAGLGRLAESLSHSSNDFIAYHLSREDRPPAEKP